MRTLSLLLPQGAFPCRATCYSDSALGGPSWVVVLYLTGHVVIRPRVRAIVVPVEVAGVLFAAAAAAASGAATVGVDVALMMTA